MTISCVDCSDRKKNSDLDDSQGHLDWCVSQGWLPGGGDINLIHYMVGSYSGKEEKALECVKVQGEKRKR